MSNQDRRRTLFATAPPLIQGFHNMGRAMVLCYDMIQNDLIDAEFLERKFHRCFPKPPLIHVVRLHDFLYPYDTSYNLLKVHSAVTDQVISSKVTFTNLNIYIRI